MKIIKATAKNFASYRDLEFNFDDVGVVLIQGPTGSGKSTLCDLVPWCFFGVTAKNGAADDVLSWSGGATEATVTLDTVSITRTRGKGRNDLYMTKNGEIIRGKDATDTQKRINETLGMTPELYLSGAYFHEFSQTAQFFTLSAKNRRQITEQIADLGMAANLQIKLSEYKKQLKKDLTKVQEELNITNTLFRNERDRSKDLASKRLRWLGDARRKRNDLIQRRDNFEAQKIKNIETLQSRIKPEADELDAIKIEITKLQTEVKRLQTEKCGTCGAPVNHGEVSKLKDVLHTRITRYHQLENIKETNAQYIAEIKRLKTQENHYQEQIDAFDYSNPYKQLSIVSVRTYKQLANKARNLETELNQLIEKETDAEILSDILDTFRASLIQNSVQQLEDHTNQLLTSHFDAEIKVSFVATDSDKIEIELSKDGNDCTFTQLSKGQRCLLKLCFGASVMELVANRNGLSIPHVFFDEALDGLDDALKLKAFNLLQTIASQHDTVYVVEHSQAFKMMFDTVYTVEMTGQGSKIGKT